MKNILCRNKILKEAGVLLIAAVMILSTGMAMAGSRIENMEKIFNDIGPRSIILLEEGFEDPWVPDSDGDLAPPDWEVDIFNLGYNWHPVTEVGPNGDPVYEGTYAAQVDRDSSDKDEWLTTPEIELSETMYSSVSLNFWAHSMTLLTDGTVKVVIKGDGFEDVIWDMIEDEVWIPPPLEWKEKILDLTSYIGGTITISWQYDGGMCYNFALDGVAVLGNSTGPPPVLEIGEIKGNEGTLLTGAIVSAEIKNVGLGDATDVEWSISVTGNAILKTINMTGNGTIAELFGSGLEIVRTDTEPATYALISKVDINVTASENIYRLSDSKNATGLLIGWKIFFINEV